MIDFIKGLGEATGQDDVREATSSITNGRELSRGFDAIRQWLAKAAVA